MKKWFKLMLVTAMAIAALTICAFAETSGVTETDTTAATASGTFASYKYTATLANGDNGGQSVTIADKNMYVLLVTKTAIGSGSSITASDIMYIDQTTATADDETNGYVKFAGENASGWIPRNYNGGYAYVTGTGIETPISLGQVTGHGKLGDMDNNGRFKSNDALIILKSSVGNYTLETPELRMIADVNMDGKIKSNDALLVLKASVGNLDDNFQ